MDKCSLSTTIIPLRRQERPRPSTNVGPVKAKSQCSVQEKWIVIGVQYKSECQYLVGGSHYGCFNTGGHPQVLTTHPLQKAAIKFCLQTFRAPIPTVQDLDLAWEEPLSCQMCKSTCEKKKIKKLTCASSEMCFKAQLIIYYQQNL